MCRRLAWAWPILRKRKKSPTSPVKKASTGLLNLDACMCSLLHGTVLTWFGRWFGWFAVFRMFAPRTEGTRKKDSRYAGSQNVSEKPGDQSEDACSFGSRDV